MNFDIFQFIGNNVRCVLNKKLKESIQHYIHKLSGKSSLDSVASSLNITYRTLWVYLNKKESIPLEFFYLLYKRYNIDLRKELYYLETGSARTKIKKVNEITINLAKLLGAHVADGHLRARETSWHNRPAIHYELILREEYFSNSKAFSEWFNSVFDLRIEPKRLENHYDFYVSNKLIYLYFTKVFKIPAGRKTETIKVPNYILKSNKFIKLAFLQGVFMFDGGVNYGNGYVSLITKSEDLFGGIIKLLISIKLEPDYVSVKSDNYGRHRIIFRKKEKLEGCQLLFERKTEKWYRLYEHLHGFKKTCPYTKENFNMLIKNMELLYPRKRKGALTFVDYINIVKNSGPISLNFIVSKLKKKTVAYESLEKLERWGIIKSKSFKNRKFWKINDRLPIMRRY